MVSTIRCEEIANEKLGRLTSNEVHIFICLFLSVHASCTIGEKQISQLIILIQSNSGVAGVGGRC